MRVIEENNKFFDDFDDIEDLEISSNESANYEYTYEFRVSAKLVDINTRMYARRMNITKEEYYIPTICNYFENINRIMDRSDMIEDYRMVATVILADRKTGSSETFMDHIEMTSYELNEYINSICTKENWEKYNMETILLLFDAEFNIKDTFTVNDIYDDLYRIRKLMLSYNVKRVFNFNVLRLHKIADRNNLYKSVQLTFENNKKIDNKHIISVLMQLDSTMGERDVRRILKEIELTGKYTYRNFNIRDVIFNYSRLYNGLPNNKPFDMLFNGVYFYAPTSRKSDEIASSLFIFDVRPKELHKYNSNSILNYFKNTVIKMNTLRDILDAYDPNGFEVCYILKIDKDVFIDMETPDYKDFYSECYENYYGMNVRFRFFFMDINNYEFLCQERPELKNIPDINGIEKMHHRNLRIYVK